ncbi:cold-shock protein [Paenibacillus profundus]|uniref:Cold-shock protein n=1 Tax=Paenibacillus profundus TaxID=1173085 RepID=A0ABS8YBQ7_9BACL|nr:MULTISPECIES: cold-shock protein [Paenibacillus]MCE5168402.1 cold-shock protein [Paenibacillus profundus]MCM3339304.1 cold-shock protein [Paenibacillus sp. MER TA 81-3]
MYYSKKNIEPVPDEQTSIWSCSSEDCSCWMRENLTFEKTPSCPLCQSSMVINTKMLPPLMYHTR